MKRGFGKRGLSPIISYILLISFIIVISVIVFQWVRTYIPQEPLECAEGVSVYVSDLEGYVCNSEDTDFSLTLRNNGRFNVAGYFIRASEVAGQIATTDLSGYGGGSQGRIQFSSENSNALGPGESDTKNFNWSSVLPMEGKNFYSLEIVPIRYEEKDNRLRLSSCGNARIIELLCEGQVSCEDTMCGDGCLNSTSEECDDGNSNNNDACIIDADPYMCVDAICGDGYVWNESGGTEECDGTVGCVAPPAPNECRCDSLNHYISDDSGGCMEAPDLTVLVTNVNQGSGGLKRQITVTYSITNNGINESNNNVYVRINPNSTNTNPAPPIEDGPFTLTPGQTRESLVLSWEYNNDGVYDPTIEIDPDDGVAESNELNNQDSIGTITCSGGSGCVPS